MNEPEITERVLRQGQSLVRAIEALDTIQPTGPIERAQVWFLLRAYRRRLRAIVAAAPAWAAEEILSASQAIRKDRSSVWLSHN